MNQYIANDVHILNSYLPCNKPAFSLGHRVPKGDSISAHFLNRLEWVRSGAISGMLSRILALDIGEFQAKKENEMDDVIVRVLVLLEVGADTDR